jgi:hypothetical protein
MLVQRDVALPARLEVGGHAKGITAGQARRHEGRPDTLPLPARFDPKIGEVPMRLMRMGFRHIVDESHANTQPPTESPSVAGQPPQLPACRWRPTPRRVPYRPADHLASRNGNVDRAGVAQGISAERGPEQPGQPFRPVLIVTEDPGTWRVIGESARQDGRQCLCVVLGGCAHRNIGWRHPLMLPSL